MAFFTRPDFDERQFKQLTGATITLSGETIIATGGTFSVDGTLKSKGIEIDATTGGTSDDGYVLTYNSGTTKITLVAPVTGGTGGGDNTFDGQRPITQSVDKPVDAGNLNTTGVTEFLEAYFFPAEPPIPSLSLITTSTTREFGYDIDSSWGGSPDYLNWSVILKTNPITSIVVKEYESDPTGIDYGAFTGTSGDVTGGTSTYIVDINDYSPATGTTSKSEIYTMTVSTASEVANANTIITWKHRRFWFKSNTKYVQGDDALLNPILTGITDAGTNTASEGSELTSSKVKVFQPITFSSEFFYYAYPAHFGVPAFTVNGLPNNAWGNAPSTLFTFTYTNIYGYDETYYLGSSDNLLNSTFNVSSS